MATHLQRRRAIRIGLGIGLVLLPMIAYAVYASVSRMPKQVFIGSGPAGGQYVQIAEMLKQHIETTYPHVTVELVATEGSLENYLLLEAGKLDFAMHQPGVNSVFEQLDPAGLAAARERAAAHELQKHGSGDVRFVANLYSQPAHLIVRRGQGIKSADLRGTLRGPECFMQMCHALSSKISAKLTRQRTDAQLTTLIEAVRSQQTAGQKTTTAGQKTTATENAT